MDPDKIRAVMFKGTWGSFEAVDAFSHEHIRYISDEEMRGIMERNRKRARAEAEKVDRGRGNADGK